MDARFLSLRSFAFLSSLSLRSYAGLYNEKTKITSNGTSLLGCILPVGRPPVDRQTPVKTLPCTKLRSRVVKQGNLKKNAVTLQGAVLLNN